MVVLHGQPVHVLIRRLLLNSVLVGIFGLVGLSARTAHADQPDAALQTVPTITSAGLHLSLSSDPNQNATAGVRYRATGQTAWVTGHAFIRVSPTLLSDSLLFLQPATGYDVEVTVTDPDATQPRVITAGFTTRPDSVPTAAARTLYVSPRGSDQNAGTDPKLPLRTIQRAADLVEPGDRVRVSAGVYRESVVVRRSGTPSSPIVFEAARRATKYRSGRSVLDGSIVRLARVDRVNDWVPDRTRGVYYATLTEFAALDTVLGVYRGTTKLYSYSDSINPERTTYDNFINRIYCPSHLTECHTTSVNSGYWYERSTKRLYVRLPNGADPDRYSMRVVKRNSHGFTVQGASHIVVRGFESRYFHVGLSIRGNPTGTAEGNVLERNYARQNQVGIGVGGYLANGLNVHRNLIQDNRIDDHPYVASWLWQDVKQNEVESYGLSVGAGSANVIRRNTIASVFNGIDLTLWWDLENPAYNRETDVHNNRVTDVGDDSIEIDGPGANVRVVRNTVRKSRRPESGEQSLSLSPLTVGPTWIVRNTFLDSRQSNFKYFSTQTDLAGPVLVYHNTISSGASDLFAVLRIIAVGSPGGMNATYRNNIFVATGREGEGHGYGYLIEDIFPDHSNPPIQLDMDYDSFFSARICQNRTCPTFRWKDQLQPTLDEFRSASGLETHGRLAAPRFVSPRTGDYRLSRRSPLIDKGIVLPGINHDFRGLGPDLGASEAS